MVGRVVVGSSGCPDGRFAFAGAMSYGCRDLTRRIISIYVYNDIVAVAAAVGVACNSSARADG